MPKCANNECSSSYQIEYRQGLIWRLILRNNNYISLLQLFMRCCIIMLKSVFNRAACIMTSCDKWNKSYSASSTASQQNCGKVFLQI